ncbi:hypothetical protein [Pseudoalteromonas phage vB_Pun_Y3]
MSNRNENPHQEHDSNDHIEDAAALFTTLAGQDSTDSEQTSDDETLDSSRDNHDQGSVENDEDQTGDDPWSQVDERLRNEYLTLQANHSKLQNDHKANAGRVQALNNKVSEYQKLVEKAEQKGEPAGKGPTADELEGMSFDEVEEEWPEVAGYLKRQLERTQQQLTKQFEEQLNPLNEMRQQQQQAMQQQQVRTELQRLQQVHPDYQEISQDSKFHQWVNAQPDTVKAMAGSLHAADNIALLNLFKSSTGRTRNARSTLADHAALPKQGSGRRIQTDPNNIDPVQLFTHLASQKK